MEKENNRAQLEMELRLSMSIMRMLGTCILAFTVWSLVKPFLTILLILPEQIMQGDTAGMSDEIPKITNRTLAAVIILLLLTFLLLLLALRLYLGFSARAEGLGKPKGRAYVIIAFVFFAVQAVLFAWALFRIVSGRVADGSVWETVTSQLLETCSLVTMGDMAFTAVRVRKLNRRLREAV